MSGGLVMSGSLERFTIDELIEVVRLSQQPMRLSLYIGQREVGQVQVQGGAVVHTSFCGLEGLSAQGALRGAPLERFEVRRLALPAPERLRPAPPSSLPDEAELSYLRGEAAHLQRELDRQRPSVWRRLSGAWAAWA